MKVNLIIICTILLLHIPVLCKAQYHNKCEHEYRPDDNLSEYRVAYYQCNNRGRNIFWDISNIEITGNHRVRYKEANDSSSIVLGIEDRTMNSYSYSGDTLLLNGFENNSTKLCYSHPEMMFHFPLNLGEHFEKYFHGYCVFSENTMLRVYGKSESSVDAAGYILLPSGECLKNVVRVHKRKIVVGKTVAGVRTFRELKTYVDSITPFNSDSISLQLNTDNTVSTIDSYYWYAAGYRYPILRTEIIYDCFGKCSSLSAYYNPPEKQLLADDYVNESIRSKLKGDGISEMVRDSKDNAGSKEVSAIDYAVSVTPGYVTITYSLQEDSHVRALLCDIRGIVYRQQDEDGGKEITHTMNINCNGLRNGEYILYINVNGQIYHSKVTIKH